MRKPTIYDLDDLINEGVVAFLKATKSYNEGLGYSFATYLSRCLDNHFCSLIEKSYRTIPITTSIAPTSINNGDPSRVMGLLSKLTKLTTEELRYLQMTTFSVSMLPQLKPYKARKLKKAIREKLLS